MVTMDLESITSVRLLMVNNIQLIAKQNNVYYFFIDKCSICILLISPFSFYKKNYIKQKF